ncbi:NADP-dependent oxidoreductase [Actinomadura macrotermitis]|uniref:2-haloacrylate reductase n=1 Tax=Actinomadura macrotermitis TaxID=2585200 RepID=A0A7K0C1H9_9ACTN|nr:2-haloacrylate reductase [Actinomadura macrotermitis]
MQAIRIHATGDPAVLRPEELPVPEPGPGEVLVQVHAAALNPVDWYARSGFSVIPAELRPVFPLPWTPGWDVSGVVAGAGAGEWREGDEVFGLLPFPGGGEGHGAYAEYVTVPAAQLARKPANVDHVRAAAVPLAGLTAYQNLYEEVGLEPGRRVLVNGAAGGVGHFAVQLAKACGAHVVAVASGRHEEFLRGLGADEFVDYTRTAAEDAVREVDHVVDTVGGPDAHRFLKAVRDGGTVTPIFLGEYHREEGAARGITFPSVQVHPDGPATAALAGLLESGAVRPGIDSVFPLEDAAAAHERAERGHIQGKIVLRVR